MAETRKSNRNNTSDSGNHKTYLMFIPHLPHYEAAVRMQSMSSLTLTVAMPDEISDMP